MTQIALDILKEAEEFIYEPFRLRKIDFAHKLGVVIVKEFGHFYKGVPVLIKYVEKMEVVWLHAIEDGLYRHWSAYLQIDKRRCRQSGISLENAEWITGLEVN